MNVTALELITNIAQAIDERGGEAYYVGECARNRVLGIDCDRITLEVYGLRFSVVEDLLKQHGALKKVNHQRGTFHFKDFPVTVELPHYIVKTDKDTKPVVDPQLDKRVALKRRVFTVDTVMENAVTGERLDLMSGLKDIHNRVIHYINLDVFNDSPVYVFRVAKLAAQYNFRPSRAMTEACRRADLTALTKEQVFAELKDALLTLKRPSFFIRRLNYFNQLDCWFKEVKDLIGVPQNEKAHQEGDVWTHTLMVVDEAAKRRETVDKPLGFMLTALCHDFGKSVTVSLGEDGIHHSYGHETAGLPLVEKFLGRLGVGSAVAQYVLNMVELHQDPHKKIRQNSSQKSFNHLFDKSVCPMDLIAFTDCDNRGKRPAVTDETEVVYEKFNIFCQMMAEPCVTIKDLCAAGVSAGRIDELMAYAHKLRLAGIDKEAALKQTLAYKPKRKGQHDE